MYLIDTRKYDDSFLLAKILEKVDITDEEKKKLFKHFEKPEVVDAEPVVRCKDCIRYAPFKDVDGVCLAHNTGVLIIMSQNGYCNLGVSREDETD